MMKTEIANLAKISQQIGSRLDYVQGGGGNISVKISSDLMAIKASGYELKNLDEKTGFAFVNHHKINQEILKFCDQESGNDEEFSAVVKLSTQTVESYPNLRPSMETGFHSLLDFTYVIHSHSVYAAILACSFEGKKIAEEIFSEMLWIDYKNPGWQLTREILFALRSTKKPRIIFLQNHGLIVGEDSADSVLKLHEEVNDKIKNHLKISDFKFEKTKFCDVNFMHQNALFPDQIVFGLSKEFAQSEVAKHIFAAYSFILQSIENIGFKPVFISKENVDFVANMESEKYRKEVAIK